MKPTKDQSNEEQDPEEAESEGLTARPRHSKPTHPRYELGLDARIWFRANGYDDVADRIDRMIAGWKAQGKKTRRNWWLVLAGSPSGKPSVTGGRPWPMLAAIRRRQGYPVHADAIERGPHELAPPVSAQVNRWGPKFRRAVK